MNQRIGAGHNASKRGAVANRTKQADVWIVADPREYRSTSPSVAEQDQPERVLDPRRHHRIDHHRPAFLRGQATNAQQQRCRGRQAAFTQQLCAQGQVAKRRREDPGFDPHRDGPRLAQTAHPQSLGQFLSGTNDHVERVVEPTQVVPEPRETTVDRGAFEQAVEPAIGICRERIGVHHEGARRTARPARDHPRARPG